MIKLAIVVGHNVASSGVTVVHPINQSEFDFNSEIAEIMFQQAGSYNLEVKVFFRIEQNSYTNEINQVYAEVNEWNADFSIELHFNAFDAKVIGTEVLSSGTSESLRYANLTQTKLLELYRPSGDGDRGVNILVSGDRGYQSVIAGKAPAIIVEPFFGDTPSEAIMVDEAGKEALAQAYLSAASQL